MSACRRFVFLLCFAFWQGGFTFYGGAVLGSEREQGFITQAVTNYLNCAGAVCVVVWGITLWRDRPRSSWTAIASWSLWFLLVLALGVLAGVHVYMDRLLDFAHREISDIDRFNWLHGAYIATSTVQWIAGLILLWLTLQTWRGDDQVQTRT
jgi:hypothetical protein